MTLKGSVGYKLMVVEKYGSYISITVLKGGERILKPNQIIEITWQNKTKDWYESKGYVFTGYRDKLYVKAEDLSKGCHKKVVIICEYCGAEFETPYVQHLKSEANHGDCCNGCRSKKTEKIMLETYGVKNMFQTDYAKNKSKTTCLQKYGVERACQSSEVKEKIMQTNLQRHGYKCTLCNPNIKHQAQQTMIAKYGVDNLFKSQDFQKTLREQISVLYHCHNIAQVPYVRDKIQKTNLEKFGVVWSTQSKEVQAKMRETLYKNGTVPTSKIERECCDLLKEIYGAENCTESFPLGSINFDCLLKINGQLIDFEYDGWYWHKDKEEQDKRRNYYVLSQGYKVLRVISKTSVPTKKQIIDAVNA
ncbi:MAG: hypothetical protein KBT06_11560, partial [Prevotellaceae bacterium]|nr:hypothetical protein [Candidatus Colivivens equi]